MARISFFGCLLILAPIFLVGQTLRMVSVPIEMPSKDLERVHFFCSVGYPPNECQKHVRALEEHLRSYPLAELGRWSFFLNTAAEWKSLLREFNGPSDSPAFTILSRRLTLMENTLFEDSGERSDRLRNAYGASGEAMLQLAITHELGHALCKDLNEEHADNNGRRLRQGKMVVCR